MQYKSSLININNNSCNPEFAVRQVALHVGRYILAYFNIVSIGRQAYFSMNKLYNCDLKCFWHMEGCIQGEPRRQTIGDVWSPCDNQFLAVWIKAIRWLPLAVLASLYSLQEILSL